MHSPLHSALLAGLSIIALAAGGAVAPVASDAVAPGSVAAEPVAAGPVTAQNWMTPTCDTVAGADGTASFTVDDGASITPTEDRLTPVAYTHLAALSTPNTLIGISKQQVHRSTDAGCSWQDFGKVEQNLTAYEIAAGPSGVAYIYGINDQPIFVVRGDRLTTAAAPLDGDGLVGLMVDPQNADHLRAVEKSGQIHDSLDEAQTWSQVGTVPEGSPWAYSAAIDPQNLDHIVLGCSSFSWVTFDGGLSWEQPTGLTEGETTSESTCSV